MLGVNFAQRVEALQSDWENNPRWAGIQRDYTAEDVVKLQGSVVVEHTLADLGARRLWDLVTHEPFINTLGAYTGAQAVNMVKAGLKAIYLSGWQVAGDGNLAQETYPDQSLYPANSVPQIVERINNAFVRADQIQWLDGKGDMNFFAPIVADAEAGFGGVLNAYELMKGMIKAGAGGVHYEDQLAAEKKCGHLGGKVLIPTSQFIRTLKSARLAADVMGVPTVLIARTDSLGANLMTSDVDPYDQPFVTGERTSEGYYRVRSGLDAAIARSLAYAPYADLLWFETSHPDLEEARKFADAIRTRYPGKMLAYNCSPSFNWQHFDDETTWSFQRELGRMGYKFQFITLAGWHMVNYHSFELAHAYAKEGMLAYTRLQAREFSAEDDGYTATRHQHEVGVGYFDQVATIVSGGLASTTALAGSTEAEQFH
ncbi:MAG: isocitrate lyase [Anaerolineae bacterium]